MMTRRALLAMTPALFAQSRKPRVLILTGQTDEPHHHWRETTATLLPALERFDVRLIEDARAITPAALQSASAVLINFNGPRLGADAERSIEAFVRKGGGLLAFHHASYGEWFGMRFEKGWKAGPDAGWTAWPELIGASWKPGNIGHSARHVFPLKWVDHAHPIAFAGEIIANDELYHKLDLKPHARVLLEAYSDPDKRGTGRNEPIAWTTTPGKGRVFFTTLGHDASALYQPGVAKLFTRAAEWAATSALSQPPPVAEQPVRVLVVTSGHSYPPSFYTVLNEMPGITWQHAASHAEIRKDIVERFDVLLLHDMHNTIAPDTQERLKSFVDAGKGVIQLHHAIVNYTSWPWWWQEVTGGKYFEKATESYKKSSYEHDVQFAVTPVKGKERHPVVIGVGPMWVDDETYKDMWHSPRIEVLMETTEPRNDRPIVYVGPFEKARVLTIQLGHSDSTMRHPAFRRLLRNAVLWTARRS